MKKIIRFLARISGVEQDIKYEIGNQLIFESFYFETENKTQQVVKSFGELLKEGFNPNGSHIRKKHFGF